MASSVTAAEEEEGQPHKKLVAAFVSPLLPAVLLVSTPTKLNRYTDKPKHTHNTMNATKFINHNKFLVCF